MPRNAAYSANQKFFSTSELPHKEENMLPPNSKVKETHPLILLQFSTFYQSKSLCSIHLPKFFENENVLYFGDGKRIIEGGKREITHHADFLF